ncbi:hypothetical protein ScPMuIL_010515 [Solemya velum]
MEVEGEKPKLLCAIRDCGEIKPGEDDGVKEEDDTGDVYADWPVDSNINFTLKDNKEQILKISEDVRKIGNNLFKAQQFARALNKYKKALRYLVKMNDDMNLSKEEGDEFGKTHLLSLTLNQAACCLRLKKETEAIELCKEALELDERNAKAVFRMGQAHSNMNNWEQALECFHHASTLEPDDKGIQREVVKVKKAMDAYKNTEKSLYTKMFATG